MVNYNITRKKSHIILYCKIKRTLNLQKSHQQLADEKGLHLVEFREENGNYPEVVASPLKVRKADEVRSQENRDFTQYVMGNRVVLRKKKYPPFFTKFPSWQTKLKKLERLRHFDETRIKLLAEYGALRSFLTEKYPEAQLLPRSKRSKTDETEME